MKKRNITDTNLILQKYLQLIATGYSTGYFELLFEHLSDDCVWESQWRIDPESGKEAVESYFRNKGRLLMESKSYPECQIIQLVGNFKTVSDAKLHVNETPVQGSFGLWYEDGKYCLLMTQNLEGKISQAIVDLTLDENDLISRIDLCIPDLFKFEKIDTNLSRDLAFRNSIRRGDLTYVEKHAKDFELNDEGEYSTYLNESKEREMQDLLMSLGAFRSWEEYGDCRFALETVNGTIIAFDSDFQIEAFKRYLDRFGLTEEQVVRTLEGNESESENQEDFDEWEEDESRDVVDDMEMIGVLSESASIAFKDMTGEDGNNTLELLEELGWELEFEGNSWREEKSGVYYLK